VIVKFKENTEFDEMINRVVQGHCLDALKTIPDNSIDCVVTSPPYYTLRKYKEAETDWGDWVGQLGREPTLDLYLDHLLLVTKEIKRILTPTGILFWNHGDSYDKNKCMTLQGYRLVLRMVEEQGWILRQRIIFWVMLFHIQQRTGRISLMKKCLC